MTLFNVKSRWSHILRPFALCGLFIAATVPAAFGGSSFSKCELVISEVSQRTQNKYDPLSNYDYLQTIDLRIRNVGSEACMGEIKFDSGAGTGRLEGGNGDSLDYILLDEHNLRKVLFDFNQQSQSSLSLNLNPGRSIRFNPRLYIPRAQSAASGKYETSIDAVFQSFDSLGQNRIAFHFGAHVRASVQANFVGVDRLGNDGHNGTVNLGELKPGLRRNLGLQLRSNSDVEVFISSENQGALTNGSLANAAIDYSIRVGGHNIDLSTTDEISLPTDLSRNGITNSVEITLDEYTNVPAGRYGDVIHIRVAAR